MARACSWPRLENGARGARKSQSTRSPNSACMSLWQCRELVARPSVSFLPDPLAGEKPGFTAVALARVDLAKETSEIVDMFAPRR
jgi:hypothetical protein